MAARLSESNIVITLICLVIFNHFMSKVLGLDSQSKVQMYALFFDRHIEGRAKGIHQDGGSVLGSNFARTIFRGLYISTLG